MREVRKDSGEREWEGEGEGEGGGRETGERRERERKERGKGERGVKVGERWKGEGGEKVGGGGRERAVEEVSLNIGILEPLTISHVIFVRLLFPQMIKAKIVFLANGNKSNLSPPE